jgi:streptogramin lyase
MPLVTTFLARWGGGWHEVTDSGAEASYGRREALLGLGALASLAEVERVAVEALVAYATPREEITASILPTTGDDAYLDWNVGDTVTVPDSAGAAVVERVVGITVSEDNGSGRAVVNPTMRDAIVPADARMMQAVKKMVNGTLRGDAKVAQPVVPTAQPRTVFPAPSPCLVGLKRFAAAGGYDIGAIVIGPDGRYWFVDRANNVVRAFDPLSASYSAYAYSAALNDAICAGPDGNLWVDAGASGGGWAQIQAIATDGTLGALYEITTLDPAIRDVCTGPDGNLWMVGGLNGSQQIATIDTAGAGLATYALTDTPGQTWQFLCAGDDGNLWATSYYSIVATVTTGGAATYYDYVASDDLYFFGRIVQDDTDATLRWVTIVRLPGAATAAGVASIDDSGVITTYDLPTAGAPDVLPMGPGVGGGRITVIDYLSGEIQQLCASDATWQRSPGGILQDVSGLEGAIVDRGYVWFLAQESSTSGVGVAQITTCSC